jgi:hypothetical protein
MHLTDEKKQGNVVGPVRSRPADRQDISIISGHRLATGAHRPSAAPAGACIPPRGFPPGFEDSPRAAVSRRSAASSYPKPQAKVQGGHAGHGVRLQRVPAPFAQTRTGQIALREFARFFSKSTWLEDRTLDMAIQLTAGATAEAVGGTIGVLMGSDGKAEAEAGRLLADLLTAWGAGDVEVMKKLMLQHGLTTAHLRGLMEAAEKAAASAGQLAASANRHAASVGSLLPEAPALEPTPEAKQAAARVKEEIGAELNQAGRSIESSGSLLLAPDF